MTTLAEVKLWGCTIGAVSLEDRNDVAVFEYTQEFLKSGIEVSPIVMPLTGSIYVFPELPLVTFHGLRGLLADSLPDRFGEDTRPELTWKPAACAVEKKPTTTKNKPAVSGFFI